MFSLVLQIVAIIVVGAVAIVALLMHNALPTERPAILNALADCIRAWRGSRRR